MSLTKILASAPSLQQFSQLCKTASSLFLEGLWSTPKALLLSLAQHKRHLLIISEEEKTQHLLEDLPFFTKAKVHHFPSWEILPGDTALPNQDLVGKRLDILHYLSEHKAPQILICPLQSALQYLPKKETLAQKCQTWKKGTVLDFDKIPSTLTALGYTRYPIAADKGAFAMRGGIIDIFPVNATTPFRVDFFDDTIEQIRTYDPISQKSIQKIKQFTLTPAKEELANTQGRATLFDYLDANTLVVFDELAHIEDQAVAITRLKESNRSLLTTEEFVEKALAFPTLYFSKIKAHQLNSHLPEDLQNRNFSLEMFNTSLKTTHISHPFLPLNAIFGDNLLPALKNHAQSYPVHFLTSSEGEKAALEKQLSPPLTKASFHKGYLSYGFFLTDTSLALIPYPEISQRRKVHREKQRVSYSTPAAAFHSMEIGDFVVHDHNGIGKFLGIEAQTNHEGKQEEFMLLEYAKGSKLYAPLSQAHLVSRYIGSQESAPALNTIGTKKWHQAKARAQTSIVGYAKELLHYQAERQAKGGFAYKKDSEIMTLFEEEFPFVETKDQENAIAAIKKDMCAPVAMDHLLCGDVGYGKTEVAMRAAFKAVVDGGKQVAVIAPTTVLAMQHFETFSARMLDFPIKIGIACRFCAKKEIAKQLELLQNGKIDILIGTHRLTSKDVAFKDLGLIIIDEEQRFGVRTKEHLKKLKTGVDCLTLSATPIPRTLYFSLVGMRTLSVINTPPQDRLPIKTIVAEKEDSLLKNALLREKLRQGQTYYIHNRVETIGRVAKQLKQLLPNLEIGIAHGQMDPEAISDIFHAFKAGSIDVLVATTIIENGIDVPNANTILIEKADSYGLADLYQMRGRVGRWNKPAYAYFLIPAKKVLPELSKKRLLALVETSGFGGGMKLAIRDLEIRGAGDILGTKQSGNISSIGFHLYCKLLKRAITTLQGETMPSFIETKIESPFTAALPLSYIEDTSLRLEIYHRLGSSATNESLSKIMEELEDRFGKAPQPVVWLYHLSRLRLFGSENQFLSIKITKHAISAEQQIKNTSLHKRLLFTPEQDPKKCINSIIASLKKAFFIKTEKRGAGTTA